MGRTAELVIIGGGIMGASIAYHLGRLGLRDIVLLEQDQQFGTGSTGKNAGGVRHQFSTEVNIELSRQSIAMMERFPEEMDQEVDINFCGYLFLLDNETDLAAFRHNVELQNRCGVESRFLNLTEIADIAPQVDLDGILGATFYERDGIADPHSVLQGYVTQARRLGVRLETGAMVTGIETDGGKVCAVRTADYSIATPNVIIAAGPWSADVAKLAGVDLLVEPIRRQIMVTRPVDGIGRDFPFTIDFSKSLYFHYESGGILTGMSDPNQAPGFDITVDPEWRMTHFEHAVRRMPLLETAELLTEWAGLYEDTPDHQPIMGRLPQVDGLYACAGFSGHGFMHGPVAGLLLAEEVVNGAAHTVNIDTLRWSRFEQGVPVGEYNVV